MTDAAERTAHISALRYSVILTRTFVARSGKLAPRVNTSAYRAMVATLHDQAVDLSGFALPWTDPDNHYWRRRYGLEYMNAPAKLLVAGLLPLRRQTQTTPTTPPESPALGVEALWLPTSVNTIVTGPIATYGTPQKFTAMSQALDDEMSRRLPPLGSELKDGAPAGHWWPDPAFGATGATDATDTPETKVRQPVRVLSALLDPHSTQTALQMAAALATGFEGPPERVGIQMALGGSALAVAGGNVGIVIADNSPAAARRLDCLHHNLVTHLAIMESMLGTVSVAASDITERWFRDQSAMLLTHFHGGTPDPVSGTGYKTRLSHLWIDNSGMTAAINEAAQNSQTPPDGPIPPPSP